jgi:hypothetical protein
MNQEILKSNSSSVFHDDFYRANNALRDVPGDLEVAPVTFTVIFTHFHPFSLAFSLIFMDSLLFTSFYTEIHAKHR